MNTTQWLHRQKEKLDMLCLPGEEHYTQVRLQDNHGSSTLTVADLCAYHADLVQRNTHPGTQEDGDKQRLYQDIVQLNCWLVNLVLI